jgi:hypothetical protein
MLSTIIEYDNSVLSTLEDALAKAGIEKGVAADITDIVKLAQQCAKSQRLRISA